MKFSKRNDDPTFLIDNNKHYPRILIATSSYIRGGLDCGDNDLVMRDGFPTSLLDFVQEMGRCGRTVDPSTNE